MSSPFNFDNWDMFLDQPPSSSTGGPSPAAPTTVSTSATLSSNFGNTPSSAASGESYQPFVSIGVSLAGAGGDGERKTFSLLYGGNTEDICGGFIGATGSSKFCTRSGGCGIQAHSRKFEIDGDSFYLKENETRAFISPSFQATQVPPEIMEDLLSRKYTIKELTALFESFQKPSTLGIAAPKLETLPASEAVEVFPSLTIQTSFELDSPKFASTTDGIFTSAPQLSYDLDDNGDEVDLFSQLNGAQPPIVVDLLKEFHQRFLNLKTKWTQTFLEVDSSHAIIVKDLQTTHKYFTALKSKLLRLEDSQNHHVSHITAKLDFLSEIVRRLSDFDSTIPLELENIRQDYEQLQTSTARLQEEFDLQLHGLESSVSTLNVKLTTADKHIKEFEKRFTIIFPILKNIHQQSNHLDSTQKISELHQHLHELSLKIDTIEQMHWQQFTSTSSPVSVTQPTFATSTVEAEIKDINAQMKILQHRIVGGGVKIGTKVFQSFEDVQLWVKVALPIRRYGLFVDAVSILDFFSCLGHIDAENQVSTLHNATKAGFTSIYESRVATSVQNIFPKVFGKGDSHQYLPAIRNPDRWDDGTDGLVYQITRGMTDVETQLSSAIDTVLDNYPEARTVASQCLFKAKRFVMDLCTFMSKDYFKWIARGHSKQDAWNMTSLCVRRIFEEIHSARVVARDIYDPNDLEFTTAKMLWATWKAHQVMEQYLRHHFYEHPSISAVLARHLADNYVKHDMGAIDKTLKGILVRLDKLEGKKPPKDKNPKEAS
jgi:hypothetical protein